MNYQSSCFKWALILSLNLSQYRNCLKTGRYAVVWKQANAVPLHKKRDKQILNYYWCFPFAYLYQTFSIYQIQYNFLVFDRKQFA